MIEPRRTGAIISQYRKQQDWTQLQLASQLHVTHQAVSRWESGESFPDLAILDAIARLFDVRVDELLYGEASPNGSLPGSEQQALTAGSVISDLAQGRPEQVARKLAAHPEHFNAVLEVAPLTPPSMMKGVIQNMEQKSVNLDHIIQLAPFLDADTLLDIVNQMDPAELKPEIMGDLAPFLGKPALDRFIDRIIAGDLPAAYIEGLTPFLSRESRDRLVEAISAEGPIGFEQLESLAPHLNQETLHRLLVRYQEGQIPFDVLVALVPFFNRETVDQLFEHEIATTSGSDRLEELIPFISKDKVSSLLNRVLDGQLDNEWLTRLAPHMDRETLNRLVRERALRRTE